MTLIVKVSLLLVTVLFVSHTTSLIFSDFFLSYPNSWCFVSLNENQFIWIVEFKVVMKIPVISWALSQNISIIFGIV